MADSIRRFPNAAAIAKHAAEILIADGAKAIAEKGRFSISLSGGSTPKVLYALLAAEYRDKLDWPKVDLYFGDERCVGPEHADSNYRMVREAMLAEIPAAVFRIPGELGPRVAADIYAGTLPKGRPIFDLVLLGMGPDGHTASIFPGHQDQSGMVTPATAPAGFAVRDRVSVTLAALGSCTRALAMVTGGDKAARLAEVLEARRRGEIGVPMTAVRPEGVEFLVDEAAMPTAGA